MNLQQIDPEEEVYRDRLSTVDEEGRRRWMYVKHAQGKYARWRTVVGLSLLAFLFAAPFVKIGANPLLMLNVVERKFSIFGMMFHPNDFHLFALAMITAVVFVGVFTLVLGRLFCGWVCPQTIFMEQIFRRIEYWIEGDAEAQRALDKAPMNGVKFFKKTLKHVLFLGVSFAVSNAFLAYLMGGDAWLRLVSEPPGRHLVGLSLIAVFSLAFYGVFAFVREQVCTNICPYGRLQSVLLDKYSVVVAYDYTRGEQRAKFRKGEDRPAAGKGDCIDCRQCLHVCPTGIDIRNGTQLECIHCTACIDACDSVMDKLALPGGLIRYTSEQSLRQQSKRMLFPKRNIVFSGVLLLLIGVFSLLLLLRGSVEAAIVRTPGMSYIEDQGLVKNLYNYTLINNTDTDRRLSVRLASPQGGKVELVGAPFIDLPAQSKRTGAFFVVFSQGSLHGNLNDIRLEVVDQQSNEVLDKSDMNFIAPK